MDNRERLEAIDARLAALEKCVGELMVGVVLARRAREALARVVSLEIAAVQARQVMRTMPADRTIQ